MAFNRLINASLAFLLSGLSLATYSNTVTNPLVFNYWTKAAPPFAIIGNTKNELSGGIIKDVGDELSIRTNIPVRYIEVPVKRLEQQLKEGRIHVNCITNPTWKEEPDLYGWSPTLFKGADRFLVRQGDIHQISSFADLEGKTVGIYNGYTYHPEIMEMFRNGTTKTEQIENIEVGVRLVNLGRIDTMIDFGTLLAYRIKNSDLKGKVTLAGKHAGDYELKCAYSPKLPVDKDLLNKHINQMKADGFIEKVLNRYR